MILGGFLIILTLILHSLKNGHTMVIVIVFCLKSSSTLKADQVSERGHIKFPCVVARRKTWKKEELLLSRTS